ncbi:ATP-binding protein [Hydrogenophaga pseudoflava]|uniref:ATP-binding protein n=1 Tax=Hydrogenophaga pseudoflava TaxID=47421 RepID=UPI0027E441A8|nr:ATP-binding protein [Hydrogenophaga pseudoflava]MDQ7745289.1 ATP-binding protein [Hydrogenophaga pseudoflava]
MVTAVALFTALAVLLLWGLSLQLQGQLRDQMLERAQLRSQQLANAMAGQMESSLAVLDLGLLGLRSAWPKSRAAFDEVEQEVLAGLPKGLVSHLSVIDAGGTVIHNSLGVVPGTFVGDRPHFQALRQGSDRLVVGEPVRSRLTGQWQIIVGRPMFRDGAFAGAVHFNVSSEHLARLLGRLALSDNDLVALVHPGGSFLARSLDNAAAMGQNLPPERPFLQNPTAHRGTYRIGGAVDGVPRLFGWQRLPGSGVVVVVGLSQASVLAPLENTRRRALLLTALLSMALLAVGAWIGWLLRNLERRQDEARASQQRLEVAQRLARVGHWTYNPDSGVMGWSQEVFRIFGQDPAVFKPGFDGYWQQVHPEDRGTLEAAIARSRAEHADIDQVHRIVRPDRSVRWVRLLAQRDPVAHERSYSGTLQDISELREAQRALEQLNTELERRVKTRTRELTMLNRDLESFTYSVSHDLRTPLRSIHGFASLLQESDADKLSDDGLDALQRIQSSARRMGLLINDLLSMAQQSRAELRTQHVNLSELARSVARELEQTDPARQVRWEIAEGLSAQADPVLMTVVMQNLLGNAWKYTGRTEAAHIEFFGLEEADGMLNFCVRDNGAGFDMAYADQLFQPFKRLHRLDEFEGTGVGLASVQRILQRHGGSVRGEGVVGQGATFCFSLPLEPVRQFLDSAPDPR